PRSGPVIFVLNHPSGLIDPAFLLCLAPRRISLLAKAPLFRMPVIGFFCRAFEAIPVHRRQDAGSDPSQNRETFDTARGVLARGGAIAIFPEGASHADPKLRPRKAGAARIAFGAARGLSESAPLRVVPAGLYYRAKHIFRSAALLYFGEPFAVAPVALEPGEAPPAGPVRELTARIEQALAAVTLQAEQAEAHALVDRAQRTVSAQDDAPAWPRPSGCGGVWRRDCWPSRSCRSPRTPHWCSSSGSTASSAARGRSVCSCSGAGRSCSSWPSAREFAKKSWRLAGRSGRCSRVR